MPKDVDKRVERTRRLLMDSLLELMAEKPYSKISVANICQHSGVARPTFYLHYHSKDGLLRGYIERMFLQFYAEVESSLTASPNVDPLIAEIMFRQWFDNARFAKLLVEADVEALMLAEFKLYVGRVMEGYINAHEALIKDRSQIHYVIDFLTGASFMVIVRWIKEDFPMTPQEMGRLYADLIRPGLLQVMLKGRI